MNKVKSYCDNCIHKEVCGKEGCGDPAMVFCDNRITNAIPVEWLIKVMDAVNDAQNYADYETLNWLLDEWKNNKESFM